MEKKRLTSVHKAIHILRLFSQYKPDLGITEISEKLGFPKSTVSRLMSILCEENLVQKNENTKKYQLSLTALEIGSVVYHQLEVTQVALPYMDKISDKVKGVVQLVKYDQGEIVYLLRFPEHKDELIINSIGNRVPSHCTAAGKMLLAMQSEEEISSYLERDLVAYTDKTITSPEKLWNNLIEIRKKGYAISHEEFKNGVSAVALPIYDNSDQVIAAISVTKPTRFLRSTSQIEYILKEMRVYSRLISEKLGSFKYS